MVRDHTSRGSLPRRLMLRRTEALSVDTVVADSRVRTERKLGLASVDGMLVEGAGDDDKLWGYSKLGRSSISVSNLFVVVRVLEAQDQHEIIKLVIYPRQLWEQARARVIRFRPLIGENRGPTLESNILIFSWRNRAVPMPRQYASVLAIICYRSSSRTAASAHFHVASIGTVPLLHVTLARNLSSSESKGVYKS